MSSPRLSAAGLPGLIIKTRSYCQPDAMVLIRRMYRVLGRPNQRGATLMLTTVQAVQGGSSVILRDRRKSRKFIPRYFSVCWILRRIAYSCMPFAVLVAIVLRILVKARTACSALLLFHGTPS